MAICAGRDKIIYFVDLISGHILSRQLTGHVGIITCLEVTDSNKIKDPFIVCGSEEYEVKIWSISSGECLFNLIGHIFDVNAVAIYSPSSNVNESIIVSGSVDSTIRVWSYGSTEASAVLSDVEAPVNALVVVDFPSVSGPLIIAGSADATIKIWSLKEKSYPLLHTMTAHMDEVTCLAAYKGEGCYDSLVSGSLDKSVIIWNLNNFTFVHHMEGHSQEVSSVCLFSTDFTDPSIASSSTDVRIRYDFKNESPNLDYVEECFQFDLIEFNSMLHDYKKWPRISKLVEQNGAAYFLGRYNDLFRKAVQESRSDFLAQFLPMSVSTVVRCIKQCSLLTLALQLDQQESVSIIISCLIAYIRDGTCLDISPSNLPIETADLLLLAKTFPSEFERLLNKMQLVLYTKELPDGVHFLRQNAAADGYEMATLKKRDQDIHNNNNNTSTVCLCRTPIYHYQSCLICKSSRPFVMCVITPTTPVFSMPRQD